MIFEVKTTDNYRPFTISFRDESDLSVIEEVLKEKEYRPIEKEIIKARHAILDIGGHIGTFSLYARNLNHNVPIFCFEPHPENCGLLKTNIRNNHIKNITIKCQAVSNTTNDATLTESLNTHNHGLDNVLESSKQTIKVSCTTIEKIISKFNIDSIDILKLDCEGSEFEILPSISKEHWQNIHCVMLEFHDTESRDHQKLISILKKQQFNIQTIPNHYDKRFGFIIAKRN